MHFVYNACVAYPNWIYQVRNAPLHGFTRLIIWLVRVLPTSAGYAMGKNLAAVAWVVIPNWRKTASRNMEIMFGDKYTQKERLVIGRKAAINLGYHVIEFIRQGFLPIEEALEMVVESEGVENFHQALKPGRGVVTLSMHYGNWEICAAYINQRVHQLNAVGKEQRDNFFTNIAFPWRAKFGVKNIMSGNKANSAIIRALRDNCLLGLVADQNGGKSGVFVDFAGTLASTVPGPAALALKFNAPIVITYCRRIAPGQLKFYALPALELDNLPEGRKAAQLEVLRRINRAYEQIITEDPTQWLWGHKRWKTRPPGEPWLY